MDIFALIKRYGVEILDDNSISEMQLFMERGELVFDDPPKEWLEEVSKRNIIYVFKDACRDYTVFKSYGAKNKRQVLLKYSFMDSKIDTKSHIPTVKFYLYFYR